MKSIIEKYKYNIRKIIYNMTGSQNEDIEQEVYIRTWKNMNKYSEQGKFKSWINTITANLCRDYLKSSYSKNMKSSLTDTEELNEIKDKRESFENELISRQRRKKIKEAIDNLKPKLREVIIMYEMEELSYEEISERLKCPVGTVRSRLFNARKELSVALEEFI